MRGKDGSVGMLWKEKRPTARGICLMPEEIKMIDRYDIVFHLLKWKINLSDNF